MTFPTVRQDTNTSVSHHHHPHHHNPHPHHSQVSQRHSLAHLVDNEASLPCSSSAPGPSSATATLPLLTPVGQDVTPRSSRVREAKVTPYIPKSEPVAALLLPQSTAIDKVKVNSSPRPEVSCCCSVVSWSVACAGLWSLRTWTVVLGKKVTI